MPRARADAPGGNWERWQWDDPEGKKWRCVECRATADEATHIGKSGDLEPFPYNLHQSTCGDDCARARKSRLQHERREERRRERTPVSAVSAVTHKRRRR